MSKYKKVEGAVPVDGNVTPISRQPINPVEADEWSDMSVSKLQEQRDILSQRMSLAASHCPAAIPAMKRGIAQLDQQIKSKSNSYGDETLI